MKIKEASDGISNHAKDLIERCPHCGAKAHIEAQWNAYHFLKNRDAEFYVVFRCKPCRKLLLKTYYLVQNPYSKEENLSLRGWDQIFPLSLDTHLSNEEKTLIPKVVLIDYEEAIKCKSIAADRAGCAMFRRALQAALVTLGADEKQDLMKQIESLNNLPKDIKDWAHQIRIFGNWGAHPDKDNLKTVDSDDLAEIHDFMSKFLQYMFVMPEKVKLSREKKDKKTSGKDDAKQSGS